MSTKKMSKADIVLKRLRKATSAWGKIKAFAAFSTFDPGYVSNVLRGKRKPSSRFIDKAEEWISGEETASDAMSAPLSDDAPRSVRGGTPGERLAWARKTLGYATQGQLAEKLGHGGRSIITNAEAGRPMSRALLYDLELKSGISRNWLETGEGDWKAAQVLINIGELANSLTRMLRPILGTGVEERNLGDILQKEPPMVGESPEEYAKRLAPLVVQAVREQAGQIGGEFRMSDLISLVENMSHSNRLKVLGYAKDLAENERKGN